MFMDGLRKQVKGKGTRQLFIPPQRKATGGTFQPFQHHYKLSCKLNLHGGEVHDGADNIALVVLQSLDGLATGAVSLLDDQVEIVFTDSLWKVAALGSLSSAAGSLSGLSLASWGLALTSTASTTSRGLTTLNPKRSRPKKKLIKLAKTPE